MAGSAGTAAGVDGCQGGDAQSEKDGCGSVGGGVVEVFYLVVEHDGERACGSGDITAEHEDDAEFAHGVKKCEYAGGQDGTASEGHKKRKDEAGASGAEEAGGV